MILTIHLKNGKTFDIGVDDHTYGLFERGWADNHPGIRCTIITPRKTYGIVYDEITHWELRK